MNYKTKCVIIILQTLREAHMCKQKVTLSKVLTNKCKYYFTLVFFLSRFYCIQVINYRKMIAINIKTNENFGTRIAFILVKVKMT